jgi:hypothetical protein
LERPESGSDLYDFFGLEPAVLGFFEGSMQISDLKKRVLDPIANSANQGLKVWRSKGGLGVLSDPALTHALERAISFGEKSFQSFDFLLRPVQAFRNRWVRSGRRRFLTSCQRLQSRGYQSPRSLTRETILERFNDQGS